ncbi:hypothetical protein AVEN_181036-1 [Araneus ventricosus]|uniref:Uncharacterized protein n=1 Tax=Araneus ventricosus TaxID=182803 RepID=A0A4Y2L3E0_ARAVE|nr:hypothetical protein AVEN_181036-1 [Araneus ventricosus]
MGSIYSLRSFPNAVDFSAIGLTANGILYNAFGVKPADYFFQMTLFYPAKSSNNNQRTLLIQRENPDSMEMSSLISECLPYSLAGFLIAMAGHLASVLFGQKWGVHYSVEVISECRILLLGLSANGILYKLSVLSLPIISFR